MKYGKIKELEFINNKDQSMLLQQTSNVSNVDTDVYWFIIVTFVFILINAFGIAIVVYFHGEEDSESDIKIPQPF